MIDHFLMNTDLLHVADVWFGNRRSALKPMMSMGSNDGIVQHLTLPPTIARTFW